MKKIVSLLLFSLTLFAQERIVTLAPSINEIVYALDMGKSVVANTKHCSYPEEAKSVMKIGGYASISLEKILSTKPTIVIGQNYDEKLNSNLEKLGIKTKIYKTTSISDIKNTILDLGKYFHKDEIASKIVDDINKSLDSLGGIVKDKRILIVISPKKDLHRQIYVSGNYLYFDDIIKASGNKNAYFSTSTMQPVVNVEKIINMNPDIIVLLAPFYDGKPVELAKLIDSWKDLPINASRNSNIYAVDKLYAGIPSDRVVYFMRDFKKILENVRSKELQ